MPDDVRHVLFTAEDQAQRALLWCPPGSVDEHFALQQLHDAYVWTVTYLLKVHRGKATLLTEIPKLLAANPYPLMLMHSCTHFARGYGLNHFLVLLLAEVALLRKSANGPVICPQVGITGVTSPVPGHVCGNPWTCHGVEHGVQVEQRHWCYLPPPNIPMPAEMAHVVVIRHGIAPNPVFAGTPLGFARQVLPYHLP